MIKYTIGKSILWMPPHQIGEAQRLHDLADEEDHFFVLEGVVEGHGSSFHNATPVVEQSRSLMK